MPGGATRRAPVAEISYVQQFCDSMLATSGNTFTGTARCSRFSWRLSGAVATEVAPADANGRTCLGSMTFRVSGQSSFWSILLWFVQFETDSKPAACPARCDKTSYNSFLVPPYETKHD